MHPHSPFTDNSGTLSPWLAQLTTLHLADAQPDTIMSSMRDRIPSVGACPWVQHGPSAASTGPACPRPGRAASPPAPLASPHPSKPRHARRRRTSPRLLPPARFAAAKSDAVQAALPAAEEPAPGPQPQNLADDPHEEEELPYDEHHDAVAGHDDALAGQDDDYIRSLEDEVAALREEVAGLRA